MIFCCRLFKNEPEINIPAIINTVNKENVDHDIKVEEDLKWVNYSLAN